MSVEKLPPPVWIATPAALHNLADELTACQRIAVDTESNSLHAFREQLCLIQFSTPQTDYLVDPLALKSITPLVAIFANPQIEKVFHAVEYDLICLKRDSDISVVNIFDTMQAARILGIHPTSILRRLKKKEEQEKDEKVAKVEAVAK